MDRSWQYGKSMVMNLLQAGLKYRFSIVPKRKKHLYLVGAKSSSLQELMETCDVVLTMLSNDAAVKEVLRDQKVYCLQHLLEKPSSI
jgi:3-hydroxyisobutyrate dehydrogenase-like beta-hydroxyacid dehydrogenase